MQYTQLTFSTKDEDLKSFLIAVLSDAGVEGFEETDEALNGFVPTLEFDAEQIDQISKEYGVPYSSQIIEQKNWNAEWEKDFQPVIIEGFCTIRADFHQIAPVTPYEIIITPKMSFGTGHHATTQLMVAGMRDIDFTGKSVFDFGTGTGILAILAEKLGALKVLGIDNHDWSVENAQENAERNDCKNVTINSGSIESVGEERYDIILANINRNILLQYMLDMYQKLADDGLILMSGLLKEDRAVIDEAAKSVGFLFTEYNELNNWITLVYKK